jgi:hypothetical protein
VVPPELIDGTKTRALGGLVRLLHAATSNMPNAPTSLDALLTLVPHVLVVLLPLYCGLALRRRRADTRTGPEVLVLELCEHLLEPLIRSLARTGTSLPLAATSNGKKKAASLASAETSDVRSHLLTLLDRIMNILCAHVKKQASYAVPVTLIKERLVLTILHELDSLCESSPVPTDNTLAYLCYALRTVLDPALLAPTREDTLGLAAQTRVIRALGMFIRRVVSPACDPSASGILQPREQDMFLGVIEHAFLG